MVVEKYEIEKFTGNNDFNLWSKKTLLASLSIEEKQNIEEVAYRTLLLNVPDNVLRQIINETTAYDVWKRLQALCVKNVTLYF